MNTGKNAFLIFLLFLWSQAFFTSCGREEPPVRIGIFRVDVSPPIGSPVAYADAVSIEDSLSARGIVLLSDQAPIVLCAVDWIGIANEGLDEWKEQLALAAGTEPDRVSVHALHQHDGVFCDFTTERIMEKYGLGGIKQDTAFLYRAIGNVADGVREAIKNSVPATHLGIGQSKVEKVASNRRVLGEDGMVKITRWSRTTDSAAIAAPEGLIDPWLKSISFWNDEEPVAVLTFYATHPQSHYGKGEVTSEFVGIARSERERSLTDLPHIHFNGAGGNITAGKYNDGSHEQRYVLAGRMEEGMRQAWEATEKFPLAPGDLTWTSRRVKLPPGKHLIADSLNARIANENLDFNQRYVAANHLAWLQRINEGHQVQVSSLRMGKVRLLNLPGELFVEYQLFAQQLKPDAFVCTAAYEEYGPGYIGTEIAYSQGGYETSERASRVSPEVEQVLKTAIEAVME